MWKETLAFSVVLTSTALVAGAPPVNPWPSFTDPAPGPARSIGEYSGGCLQGGQALPLDGMGYQVMRPSRRRNFGHPALIDYVRQLGKRVRKQGLGVMLVGDLSHARGGRAASGHASHQIGLDVDIWYFHPERARKAPLPLVVREELVAASVLDPRRQTIVPRWKKHVARTLRIAVEDERVERVFVNPAIKRALCEQPPAQRAWLRKLRPWRGHDDHFHVRLACTAGDPECRSQGALPEGDGCDKLSAWFKRRRAPARRLVQRAPIPVLKPAAPPAEAVAEGPSWPERCNALLESSPSGERLSSM